MRAVLIGPDIESEQWVSEVASLAGVPYRVLRKERLGDRDVRITIPDLHEVRARTPVLIDDIVSSGRTMIEAARQLRSEGLTAPVCIAVHECSFFNFLATARAFLTKSSASGLSVRFLNVTITILLREFGNSIGKAFSKRYLP